MRRKRYLRKRRFASTDSSEPSTRLVKTSSMKARQKSNLFFAASGKKEAKNKSKLAQLVKARVTRSKCSSRVVFRSFTTLERTSVSVKR